jgi:hypothetical protein
MWIRVRTAHGWALVRLFAAAAILTSAAACSPGTLPGSPSPLAVGGGGGRYNGSITYRRLGGNYSISEVTQTLNLSLVVREGNQITGRFESGNSSGTLTGILRGDLGSGTFEATVLVLASASQGAATVTCEGRGQVTGTLTGRTLSWTSGSTTYDNCAGLNTTSEASAVAVSPVPGAFPSRASVIITVLGGPAIARGTCAGGASGFPFTVEMKETTGIDVTFDSTFVAEERRSFGGVTQNTLDMPFTDLNGGSRRTYGACSPVAGTYQAFFSGTDANGNRVRVASPIVTMGP